MVQPADTGPLYTDEMLLRAMRLRGDCNALKVSGTVGAGSEDQAIARFGESIAVVFRHASLGFLFATTPAVLERMDEVDAWFAERQVTEASLEVAPLPAHEPLMTALVERGYPYRRSHAIFGTRLPSPVPPPENDAVIVRPIRPDERTEVARIVAVGGGIEPDPDTLDRIARQNHSGFHVLVACIDDDRPVAMGTMSVHGSDAYFGRATTLPGSQRRGCQRALLAARLQLAAELGLAFVGVDTHINSTSHRNCHRAGFTLLGYIASFVKRTD